MARSQFRETQVLDVEFISPMEHEGLHDCDKYVEFTRQHGKVVSINTWKDISKVYKISSTALERHGGKVIKIVKDIYDYYTGTVIIATVTGTLSRQYGKVTNIVYSRDNDMGGI